MNNSVNPNVLWNEYGITSYNYGTGGQPIDVTYYLLKEALKVQSPKVVVVDLYYLGFRDKYGSEGYIRYVLDSMKFSLNKMEAIMNCTPKEENIYYTFPLLKYHTRWKELSEGDFTFDLYESAAYYTKGFAGEKNIYGEDNNSDFNVTEIGTIPEKSEEYLYKFIELSNEYEFDLIFVNAPYDYTSTDGKWDWVENDLAMFNKVGEIAAENEIPFINYSTKEVLEDINFDFGKDMNNIGHCNIWGANKVSKYLADFLNENYDLYDYRNDVNYKTWQEDYDEYLKLQ